MKGCIEKNLTQEKKTSDLRSFYKGKAKKLSREKSREKSKQINQLILKLPFLKSCSFIAVYKALKEEPCLFDFYSQYKKQICFPVVQKDRLEFHTNPQNKWKKNHFQIEEPLNLKETKIPLQNISLFFVPGSCFDREGARLGKGFGFYDKTLSQIKSRSPISEGTLPLDKRPLFIGVAFTEQMQSNPLPSKTHDIRMDLLVTDQFILYPINTKKGL